jgi:hypothetical protein
MTPSAEKMRSLDAIVYLYGPERAVRCRRSAAMRVHRDQSDLIMRLRWTCLWRQTVGVMLGLKGA